MRVAQSIVDDLIDDVKAAEKETDPSPTDGQKEAGNYAKGKVSVQGLEITVENPKGSSRSGTGKDGKPWKVTMPATYGYISRCGGATAPRAKDKDHLDVYIGPDPDSYMVFVVNQQKEDTKAFDEHKIFIGFKTKKEAIDTYDRAFSNGLGPKLRDTVMSTTVDKLKDWIASGDTKKPFDGIVESLLEDGPDVEISPITEADMPEVKRILLSEFGRFGDWAWGTIERDTDWSMSRKAVVNGQIVGAYAIGTRQLKDGLAAEPQDKIRLYEDVSRYDSMRGVEGVALASTQEVRGSGVGRALKDSVRMIDADYIWGSQLKALNNLQQWLRRRVLVAETDDTYFNVEVLNGANAAVESLLEAEEEFGYERLKALAMRVHQIPEGTKFHIGFAIRTSSQFEVEARANDDAIQVDWDAVNHAIIKIESNAQNILNEVGVRCRGEGHSSDDVLVGSAWVTSGTGGFYIIKDYVERGEPYSTSSGTAEKIKPGFAVEVYRGVPEQIATLIDVDISFFDIDREQMGLEENDQVNPKDLALRTKPTPRVWGDLKQGDVLYNHDLGAYERIEGTRQGYGQNYQDETGAMQYDSRPTTFVLYSQFGPAYAYGHYVQQLSIDARSGLLGTELVELADTSDEALWKLVDADMIKDGRKTAEQLQQDRAAHQAWLARPEQQAQADARARLDQLLADPANE